MNAAPPPAGMPPVVPPPKPPIPSTNLLPAIIIVAVVSVLCLALAIVLPAPRRPATTPPPPNVPVQPLPLPAAPFPGLPITEFEDTTRATFPTPSAVTAPTAASPTAQPTPETSPTAIAPVPAWKAHAQPTPAIPVGNTMLAIVIDDMGVDDAHTRQAMEQLPTAVTFAFLPYGRNSRQLAATAHSNGHEILVHLPMEALARANGETAPSPGPRALMVNDDAATRADNLARNIAALSSVAVGVNNHMGSRFTQWEEGMRDVLLTLEAEGLLFLDSVTTAHTATRAAARNADVYGIPLLRRDVFLDDKPTPEEVARQLMRAVAMSKQKGHAIAIGHPHPATLAVLGQMLPLLEQEGITLVPLTSLIKQ